MLFIEKLIATELNIGEKQVVATIELLKQGVTIPFIARYRKEKTGSLDDTQLRILERRLKYLQCLAERKATILKSIRNQGKLSENLKKSILATEDSRSLEEIYAPFKQKRHTKAQIARKAGLESLANSLLNNPNLVPLEKAKQYCNTNASTSEIHAALDGARSILIENICEDPLLVNQLRELLWRNGFISAKLSKANLESSLKYKDYFNFRQTLNSVPSHRALALFRGRRDGILALSIDVDLPQGWMQHPFIDLIMSHFGITDHQRAADKWLIQTTEAAWKKKLHPSLTTSLLSRLKEQSDMAAIKIFRSNLREILLAAPAGPRTTMGLDPGLKTGVKVAIVSNAGKILDTHIVYPHAPYHKWHDSIEKLSKLCIIHDVEFIAIGNGTASRETDRLVVDLINSGSNIRATKVVVSEAGASVYSASQLAADEFPSLDVSLRGAVSIARRLQDPLSELVKIAPKSIGVGQYQHDVNQNELAQSLVSVVQDCVNSVGVDINTASETLLTYVAGLNATIARNIINYRDENGPFKDRNEIKKVPRIGPKVFEQAAGFLRIMNGINVLDASAVHPEAYGVVEKIARATNRPVRSIIGDVPFLRTLNPSNFVGDHFGLPTLCDIVKELEKPGRDPRPEFKIVKFTDGVENISDLQEGMLLEGVITNVTAFGAFVDIGIHQGGLVHVSELSDTFTRDPREIVKTGDIVKVIVKKIDIERKRVALSMKSNSI
ncbi:MAG: RNA-binding transcriptional accessory protein [Hyphomicrobiaceae bacterium]|nr:RNA-binding transcriptional accessory protein [Hyphomicrobiaceae bacterium]